MPPSKGVATKGKQRTNSAIVPARKATKSRFYTKQPNIEDLLHVSYASYLDMQEHERKQTEISFTFPVNIPLQGDWAASESYWLQKDREMLRYIQDWPISQWLISQDDATAAHQSMQHRFRLREQGKSVYIKGIPSYWPFEETPKPEYPTKFLEVDTTTLFRHKQPAQAARSPGVASTDASIVLYTDQTMKEDNEKTVATKKEAAKMKVTYNATITSDISTEASKTAHTRPKRPSRPNLPQNSDNDENNPQRNTSEVHSGHDDSKPKRSLRSSGFTAINTRTDALAVETREYSIDVANDSIADVTEPPGKKRKRKISDQSTEDGSVESTKKFKKENIRQLTPPPYDQSEIEAAKLKPDFPWQTEYAAAEPEEWDDSIYDPARLEHIRSIHARNMIIVSKYMENGKHGADKRKTAAIEAGELIKLEDLPPVGAISPAEKPEKKRGKSRKSTGKEQREHFSGSLIFADVASQKRFNGLSHTTIEDAINAAMLNPYDEVLMNIEVAHDPGDSILANLDRPRITIMDIARTRLQLLHVRVLTKRAAECLIDFCPDLLNTYRLLQVVSETDFGNTSVQIRLGYNGSMLSDSTITKRVSATLGREYDKEAAEIAFKKDPEFKKTNRDNYHKYKAWRSWKRVNGTPLPNNFNLVDAAKTYADGKEARDELARLTEAKKRRKSGDSSGSSVASGSRSGSRRGSMVSKEIDTQKVIRQAGEALGQLQGFSIIQFDVGPTTADGQGEGKERFPVVASEEHSDGSNERPHLAMAVVKTSDQSVDPVAHQGSASNTQHEDMELEIAVAQPGDGDRIDLIGPSRKRRHPGSPERKQSSIRNFFSPSSTIFDAKEEHASKRRSTRKSKAADE